VKQWGLAIGLAAVVAFSFLVGIQMERGILMPAREAARETISFKIYKAGEKWYVDVPTCGTFGGFLPIPLDSPEVFRIGCNDWFVSISYQDIQVRGPSPFRLRQK
jgi:hypothetical protein